MRTLAASLAHAQAAEDTQEDAPFGPVVAAPEAAVTPVAPVIMAPAMVAPVACATTVRARPSVMANRWSVGLALGSMTLAPEGAPDAKTTFATGELALRFRATPHLELEATAGGGRERTADDRDGDLAVATFALAARYRFRPEAAWNWFVMGGVGAASVTQHDASDEQRNRATQPLGMLGVGVERRFRHLALHAEARAVALGQREDDKMDVVPLTESGTAVVTPAAATRARGGGSLELGVSYYF